MSEFFSQGCLDLIDYVKSHAQAYIDNGYADGGRWYQKDCADAIGVNDTFLTHMLRGRKRPSLDTAFFIQKRTNKRLLAENWTIEVKPFRVRRSLAAAHKIIAKAKKVCD